MHYFSHALTGGSDLEACYFGVPLARRGQKLILAAEQKKPSPETRAEQDLDKRTHALYDFFNETTLASNPFNKFDTALPHTYRFNEFKHLLYKWILICCAGFPLR